MHGVRNDIIGKDASFAEKDACQANGSSGTGADESGRKQKLLLSFSVFRNGSEFNESYKEG